MKKCPYCAEMIQDEAILCRYCGSSIPRTKKQINNENPGNTSLEKTNRKSRRTKRDLEKPISGFYYFLIGLAGYFLGFFLFLIVFLPIWSTFEHFRTNDSTREIIMYIVIFCFLLVAAIIASRGMMGKADFWSVIGMMLLPFVPIIGEIAAFYYLGKGLYMLTTKQKFIELEIT